MKNEITLRNIANWINSGKTGLSSEYLCSVYLGGFDLTIHYPHDPSDFNRCVKFMDCLDTSDAEALLELVSTKCSQWKAIRDNWVEMCVLLKEEMPTGRATKLYELMNKIGL